MGILVVIGIGVVLVVGYFFLRYLDASKTAEYVSRQSAIRQLVGDILRTQEEPLDRDPDPLICRITLERMGEVVRGKELYLHYAFKAGEPFPLSDIADVEDGELVYELHGRDLRSDPFAFVPAAVATHIVSTLNHAYDCPIAHRPEKVVRAQLALKDLPHLSPHFESSYSGWDYVGERVGGPSFEPRGFIAAGGHHS